MRILSAKGLIEIRQKIGTRVSDKKNWNVFDSDILRWHHESGQGHDVMRDLIEMRQILEPEAAKLAAARASIDDHQNLQLALKQMLEEINSPDGYARADLDFHLAIYSASKNSLLVQFGTVVADFLKRVFMMQQKTVRENKDLLQDIELHKAVHEQISKGDGQAAEQAMLKLVLEGKRALIDALNSDSKPNGPAS
jgi:DNA-binding FadR family transcriptional regulator